MELKAFQEIHQETMLDILTDPQVRLTYMLPDFSSREAAIPLFQRLMQLSQDSSRYVRGIFQDGELVGFLNDVEVQGTSIELGYVISPKHWNRGYATAALKLAIAEQFSRGFREVITGAFQENPASLRVMEKAGMTLLEKQDIIAYRGRDHICIYYSMQVTI
ncbi:MAG: GNAT family N-acetyltransferase [Oscillospiraceae bacterium]|nr:GNAT family N-acetyltransferase [Oscillospiraceae bacterium]